MQLLNYQVSLLLTVSVIITLDRLHLQLLLHATRRSSVKKVFTKFFAKFTGKHLFRSLLFHFSLSVSFAGNLQTPVLLFSVHLAKILRIVFLKKTPPGNCS